jgi:hemolysin activation/secretion protein
MSSIIKPVAALKTATCVLSVGFALLAYTSTALATSVPSSADAGVISRDLDIQRETPSRMDEIIRFSDEDINNDNLSDEKLFTLTQVVLEGSSVYSQADIDRILKKFYGQETSFRDLNEINQILTRKYRDDGYIFSRTELSPQKIQNGVVRITVLEGRIGSVSVVGDYKDPTNLIKKLANKIQTSGPANTKTLERYLLLINDIPGITARSVIEPAAERGAGNVIITVEQEKFEGSATLDNRGSGYLGQVRATLVGALNSLFTVDDRTTLRGILSADREELKFADLSHERQIGTEGLRVIARVATTDTKPGQELKVLPVEGESQLADIEVQYPVLRSRQYNLNILGGFNATNSETDVANLNVAKDRVRSVRAGGRFDSSDQWAGINVVDLQFTKGVDWLNATENGLGRSKANGDQEFFKTNLSLLRLQELGYAAGGNFSLQLAASGQYSKDALLSAEEFSIGGGEFGRAFDSGETTGDKGVAGSVELRYGSSLDTPFLNSYELYGFYDLGKAWNIDPVVGETEAESLASAGLGTRFNLPYDLSGYAEISKPLTKPVDAEQDEDSRFFFSLTKRF